MGNLIPLLVFPGNDNRQKFPYSRPEFLYFSDDEIAVSADQNIRPILCPKFPDQMIGYAGYAEVINAGKTVENEDMAAAKVLSIVQQGYDAEKAVDMPESSRRGAKGARERSISEARKKKDVKQEVLQRRKSDEDLLIDFVKSFEVR